MNPLLLLLVAALAAPPTYDIFVECDYERVQASGACEQRELAARSQLEDTWASYAPAKQAWCVQQVAERIQINHYLWLHYCLAQTDEQPMLPHKLAPFWGPQPNE